MNTIQISRLQNTLLYLNKTLHDLENWIGKQDVDEIMYYWRNSMTPEDARRAKEKIIPLRAAAKRLAMEFKLKREEDDPISAMKGHLSALWVRIEDTKSKVMRNYGEIEPGLSETLDPRLEELGRMVQDLDHALNRGAGGAATDKKR